MGLLVLVDGLVLYGQEWGTVTTNLLLGSEAMLAVIVSLAAAYAFRRKTVLIDATGIHVERGFRSDVRVRWGDLREIGLVKFPLSEWFAPFTIQEPPRTIMLRGRDGGALGMVQPDGDVPREASAALESAIRAHAAAHGVPIRDVGYREMFTWRRPRRGPLLDRGGP